MSIFVNPLQFGPGKTMKHIPEISKETGSWRRRGVDVLFTPAPEEMYKAESTVIASVKKGPMSFAAVQDKVILTASQPY